MKSRSSILGWLAGALFAGVLFGGCTAQPTPSSSGPPGLKYYPLKGDNLYPDSFYYTITGIGGDGLWYWTEVYYLHYRTKPGDGKPPLDPPWWDHRPGHGRRVKIADDSGCDYGWDVDITHPGGGYTAVGTKTMITHPGGSPAATTAK